MLGLAGQASPILTARSRSIAPYATIAMSRMRWSRVGKSSTRIPWGPQMKPQVYVLNWGLAAMKPVVDLHALRERCVV